MSFDSRWGPLCVAGAVHAYVHALPPLRLLYIYMEGRAGLVAGLDFAWAACHSFPPNPSSGDNLNVSERCDSAKKDLCPKGPTNCLVVSGICIYAFCMRTWACVAYANVSANADAYPYLYASVYAYP